MTILRGDYNVMHHNQLVFLVSSFIVVGVEFGVLSIRFALYSILFCNKRFFTFVPKKKKKYIYSYLKCNLKIFKEPIFKEWFREPIFKEPLFKYIFLKIWNT